MPLRYEFLGNERRTRLTEVKHNCVDKFDEGHDEDEGRYLFAGQGGWMWLARRSTRGIDSELVLYIVDFEDVAHEDYLERPQALAPSLVIPVRIIQKIKKEKTRSTGETTGRAFRRAAFKILAEVDFRRGPEWFTLKMEHSEYTKCKAALASEAPNLRFSSS